MEIARVGGRRMRGGVGGARTRSSAVVMAERAVSHAVACFLIFRNRRVHEHAKMGARGATESQQGTRALPNGASPERKFVPFDEFLVDASMRMLHSASSTGCVVRVRPTLGPT